MNQYFFSSLMAIAIVISGPLSIESSVFAQTQTGSTSSNATTSNSKSQITQLNKTMAET
jgi:hypothetical protein